MKKIGLLCLALVLALGSLGVAGALWSDWLYIDGYVETGYIGAEWSLETWYVVEEKEVSFIDAYLNADRNVMTVNIWNAYPSATYVVKWDIHNTGSIPIHFDNPSMWGDLPPDTWIMFAAYDPVLGDLINMYGYQLHPGETMYGQFTIHLDNDAEQGSYYYFEFDLQYGQYNEFPLP